MSHKNSGAREIARDTVAIIEAGEYRNAFGRVVAIHEVVEAARGRTINYPPEDCVPKPVPSGHATRFEVTNETTLPRFVGWLRTVKMCVR